MTKPLVLLVYQNLLPGSQLLNRLQDLGYRVQTLAAGERLIEQAQNEKPMFAIIDLAASGQGLCSAIKQMKDDPTTAHIPIMALTGDQNPALQAEAQAAGASLVASDKAMLAQLPQLLEQLLRVE